MSKTVQTEALYEFPTPDDKAFENIVIEKGTGKDNRHPYWGYAKMLRDGQAYQLKPFLVGHRTNSYYGKKLYVELQFFHPIYNTIKQSFTIPIIDYNEKNKDIVLKGFGMGILGYIEENGCALTAAFTIDESKLNFYRIVDYDYEKGILKLRFKLHFKFEHAPPGSGDFPKEIDFDDGIVYAIEQL